MNQELTLIIRHPVTATWSDLPPLRFQLHTSDAHEAVAAALSRPPVCVFHLCLSQAIRQRSTAGIMHGLQLVGCRRFTFAGRAQTATPATDRTAPGGEGSRILRNPLWTGLMARVQERIRAKAFVRRVSTSLNGLVEQVGSFHRCITQKHRDLRKRAGLTQARGAPPAASSLAHSKRSSTPTLRPHHKPLKSSQQGPSVQSASHSELTKPDLCARTAIAIANVTRPQHVATPTHISDEGMAVVSNYVCAPPPSPGKVPHLPFSRASFPGHLPTRASALTDLPTSVPESAGREDRRDKSQVEAMLQVLLERMQAQEDTMRQLHNKLADMQCSNMPLDNVSAQRISAVGAGCVKRSVSKEVSSHEAALAERPQGAVPREARAAPDDRARPPDSHDFWT